MANLTKAFAKTGYTAHRYHIRLNDRQQLFTKRHDALKYFDAKQCMKYYIATYVFYFAIIKLDNP